MGRWEKEPTTEAVARGRHVPCSAIREQWKREGEKVGSSDRVQGQDWWTSQRRFSELRRGHAPLKVWHPAINQRLSHSAAPADHSSPER